MKKLILILSFIGAVSISICAETFRGNYCYKTQRLEFYPNGKCVVVDNEEGIRGEGTYEKNGNGISISWDNGATQYVDYLNYGSSVKIEGITYQKCN